MRKWRQRSRRAPFNSPFIYFRTNSFFFLLPTFEFGVEKLKLTKPKKKKRLVPALLPLQSSEEVTLPISARIAVGDPKSRSIPKSPFRTPLPFSTIICRPNSFSPLILKLALNTIAALTVAAVAYLREEDWGERGKGRSTQFSETMNRKRKKNKWLQRTLL